MVGIVSIICELGTSKPSSDELSRMSKDEDLPLPTTIMAGCDEKKPSHISDISTTTWVVGNVHKTFPWVNKWKGFLVLSWPEVAEVRAGGGEVKGGGVIFGVSRIFLSEIPEDIMGENGGEAFGVDGGAD
ncbi:hypothetical protein Tco_1061234 [Tanacetum coccineum]